MVRGHPSFLHLKLTCFLLSPRICFSLLFRCLCLVQCLCPEPCFIKQLPNCMPVSLSYPGSVVDHWNLGWKRPSGLPLSPPGPSSCSRARSFLIGWYLQHRPIWKLTLRFLSRQPLFSLNVSKWNNTKQNIHTYIFFGGTALINKWPRLLWFLFSLPETQSVRGEKSSFSWKKGMWPVLRSLSMTWRHVA